MIQMFDLMQGQKGKVLAEEVKLCLEWVASCSPSADFCLYRCHVGVWLGGHWTPERRNSLLDGVDEEVD